MKVVASSKMNPMQAKAVSVSPFFDTMQKTFEPLVEVLRAQADTKIITLVGTSMLGFVGWFPRIPLPYIVSVTSDKGLCGGTNNNITRMLLKEDLSEQDIIIWGDKGCGAFENSKYNVNVKFSAHPDVKNPVSFIDAGAFAEKVEAIEVRCVPWQLMCICLCLQGFDLIRVVYNKMLRPGVSEIVTMYLPTLSSIISPEAENAVRSSLMCRRNC